MTDSPPTDERALIARTVADLYLRELWAGAAVTRHAAALRRAGMRDEALAAHLARAARRRDGLKEILDGLAAAPPPLVGALFHAGGSTVGWVTGRGRAGRVLRVMDAAARRLAARYGCATGRPMPPEIVWRIGGFQRDLMLFVRWLEERIIFPDPARSPLKGPAPPATPPGAAPP